MARKTPYLLGWPTKQIGSQAPHHSLDQPNRSSLTPLTTKPLGNLARRLNVIMLYSGHEPLADQKNRKAMISLKKRYGKLKRAATRMMMAGDVQRYLHALRLMNTLRGRMSAAA